MKLFCDVKTFKEALKSCIELLQEDELKIRGLVENAEGVEKICRFLNYIVENIQVHCDSYEDLLKILQNSQIPREYSQLVGLMGKFLDAIQILKPHTIRNTKVRESIINALKRTGHGFLWNELEEREKYENELIKATATYPLLEIASLIESNQSRNPINTLRDSMGARLPEEYFSELLAGWIIEDVLRKFLEFKEFVCSLEGPDRGRKIQFVRPTEMGVYDFKTSKEDNTFYLEIQRVGKISKTKGNKKIRTYLKKHKYEGGDNKNKILILWIGEPPQKNYKKWNQKIILLSNLISKNNIAFKDENIYLPEEILEKALTWQAFKQKSGDEILKIFQEA